MEGMSGLRKPLALRLLRDLTILIALGGVGLWGGSSSAQISCSPCTQTFTISTSELFRGCVLGEPLSYEITAKDIQDPQPITLSKNLLFQVEFALTNYIVSLRATASCTGILGCGAEDFKLNLIETRKKTRSPTISVSTTQSPCKPVTTCSLELFQEIFRGGDTAGVSGENACSSSVVDGAVSWQGKLLLDLRGWDVTGSGSVFGTLEALVEDQGP